MKGTFGTLSLARKTAVVGAAASVVAVFLPWVSVLGLSVSGISTGDGKIVLIVAAAALVVLAVDAGFVSWFAVSRKVANIVSLAAAALCLLVAIADMTEFAALGLYVLLLASLAWVAAATQALRKESTPVQAATQTEAPSTTDS